MALLDEAGTIRAVIRGRKNILLICATADEASQRLQSITHELEKAIGPAAQRVYGVPFVAYQQNNSADAKHARIKSLQPLCAQGMLLFDHASQAPPELCGVRGGPEEDW